MFDRKAAEAYLLAQGLDVSEYGDAEASEFRVRVLEDQIQAGWMPNWDRWANSVDWVFFIVPEPEIDLVEFLHYCLSKRVLNVGWGQREDVYPWLRQFRRELAANPDFKAPREKVADVKRELVRQRRHATKPELHLPRRA